MEIKPQDIVFFLSLGSLIYLKKPLLSSVFALFCLLLAIPLFAFWVFFTAERLTWYAGVFVVLAAVQYSLIIRKGK